MPETPKMPSTKRLRRWWKCGSALLLAATMAGSALAGEAEFVPDARF